MSLLRFEGFDHESSSGDLYAGILSTLIVVGATQSASVAVYTTTQFGTGQCLGVTASSALNANANAFVVMPFTTASNAVVIGAVVSLSASVTNGAVLGFVNGMLGQVYIYVGGGGIKVFCGDPTLTSVQIGVVNNVIASLGWAYIEMSVVINNAPLGSINVMVNGTSVFSMSGVDTSNDNTTGVSGAMLGTINTFGTISGYTSFFDDVYVCDATGIAPYNTFLGPVRVITQFPIANGTITSFTGLAHHANYLNVGQVMDGDATYNSSATTGSIDTFFGGTLPAGTSSVFAVKVVGAGRIDDSGIRTVQTYLKSGNSVTTGASNNLVGSYQYFSDMYITDPNTTVQWSASGVNLVQFGYKIVPSPGSPVAIGFASIIPVFVAAMQQVVSLTVQSSVGSVATIGIFGQVIQVVVSIGTMKTVAAAVQGSAAHVGPLSIGAISAVGSTSSGQFLSGVVSLSLSITGAALSQLGSGSALITLHPVIAPPVGGYTIVQGLGIFASVTISSPKTVGVLGQLVSATGTSLLVMRAVVVSTQNDLMRTVSAIMPIACLATASSANASNIHIGLSAWINSHNYTTIGARVASTFSGTTNAYQLVSFTSTGLSGTTPPNGTGSSFPDGLVVWKYLSHVDYSDLTTWANSIPATLTQPVVGLVWNNGPITTTTGTPFLTLGTTASPRVTSAVNTITLKPAPGESIRDKLAGGSTTLNFNSTNGVSFVLPSSAGGVNYFDVCDGNVIFSGLQFQDPNATSASTIIHQENSSSAFTLTNCIIDGYAQAGGAVMIQGGTGVFHLTNCLIVDRQTGSTNYSPTVSVQSATTNVINCTVLALGAAPGAFSAAFIANSAASVFRNDIIMGYPVGNGIDGGGGMICPTDHCLFDSTNPGSAAIDSGNNLYSKTLANQFNYVTNDFRLKAGADALNAGATDTTDIPTSDDIAGTHRPVGLAWDIGAYELVATVPTVPNGIYVLASVVASAIASAPVYVKVVEATSDGVGAFWPVGTVTTMKSGGGIVLGYLDCGWLENYRSYYATAVAAGINSGVYPDPQWPQETDVAFWSTAWHNICFSWCDGLMAAGFNGIYLDVVDAWGDAWCQANVPGGGATNSANAMIALIQAIKTHAHATNPNFQVWVNGGEELFAYSAPSFFNALDGMYKEQVLYPGGGATGGTAISTANRNAERALLRVATDGGKPVILIEYVSGATAITDVHNTCATWGFGYYIAAPNENLSGVDTEGFV